MRVVATVIMACLLGVGCGTTLPPPRSPRITVNSEGYYRDGRTFLDKYGSGDRADLVSGNPKAEALMRSSDYARWGSYGALVLGVVGSLGSVSIPNKRLAITGGQLSLVAMLVFAGIFSSSSQGYLQDAINVYNDDVFQRERVCEPPNTGGQP